MAWPHSGHRIVSREAPCAFIESPINESDSHFSTNKERPKWARCAAAFKALRPYTDNRKAVEGMIDADPIAACVREFMSERSSWTGSAADLLRVSVKRSSKTSDSAGWPKNPRALAGHLRRAQTFLRALGIDISFSREGGAGSGV